MCFVFYYISCECLIFFENEYQKKPQLVIRILGINWLA